MRPNKPRGFIKSASLAFLAVAMISGSAKALDQRQTRHLTDSLATVYESAGHAPGRFAPDARLKDYLVYAAKQSPALKAAFYQWKSVVERSGYAGTLPDPVFTYTYFIENVETRVGPQNQRFKLMQTFPWFGTLSARKDVTLEAANAAYQAFRSEKLKLFYQVKSAYYDFYFLGRDIAITKENLELLKFWESVARAKYRVALKQHPDVIKAQVELVKLEDRLHTAEDMMEPVMAKLRAVTNLPDSVQLPVPTNIEVVETAVDRDSIVTAALANNPDLKSLLSIIDKTTAAKRLASKMSYPNFTIGVDYIETGEARGPGVLDSGEDAWMASVGVSLPIWFGANQSRKKEAEAQYRKARNDYANAQNHLKALTEKIVFEYEDALRKTRLYRDGLIPKAEQSLNTSYTSYQAGEADFLSVLDAQRQLLDFQLEYERAKSDLAVSRAEIEMVIGRGLTGTPIEGFER
ncbi:MAG: TolC family protein [Candidatus Latescibacterota bacterium]|nr:MAG: TolC family protein [Candidatus Latescibacterota bacterium]